MKTTISTHTDTSAAVSGEWNSEKSEMVVRSYHELADQPVVETDLLTEFRGNIMLLEEMQARMGFAMREIRYLLKMNS